MGERALVQSGWDVSFEHPSPSRYTTSSGHLVVLLTSSSRAATLRIYYESTHPSPSPSPNSTIAPTSRLRTGEWIPNVPIGYSHQPRELRIVPSTWYRKIGPLVFDRHNESGGHFWAWEKPESVVRDLRDMFRKPETGADANDEGVGGAFGLVEGRSGYA